MAKRLKTKVDEAEKENESLKTEVKTLTDRLTAIREEKDRLGLTDEIQGQEIERLMSERDGLAGKGSEASNDKLKEIADSIQLQKVQQRVSTLEHNQKQIEMDRNRLMQEKENDKENALKMQKALNDEIDALKEREN